MICVECVIATAAATATATASITPQSQPQLRPQLRLQPLLRSRLTATVTATVTATALAQGLWLTAYCLLLTAYCLLPTAYGYGLRLMSYSLLLLIFLMTQHLGSLLLLTSPLPVLFSSVAIISCLLFLRTRGGWGDAIDRTAHRGSSRSIARAPSPPSLATLAGLTVLHHVLPAHPFN